MTNEAGKASKGRGVEGRVFEREAKKQSSILAFFGKRPSNGASDKGSTAASTPSASQELLTSPSGLSAEAPTKAEGENLNKANAFLPARRASLAGESGCEAASVAPNASNLPSEMPQSEPLKRRLSAAGGDDSDSCDDLVRGRRLKRLKRRQSQLAEDSDDNAEAGTAPSALQSVPASTQSACGVENPSDISELRFTGEEEETAEKRGSGGSGKEAFLRSTDKALVAPLGERAPSTSVAATSSSSSSSFAKGGKGSGSLERGLETSPSVVISNVQTLAAACSSLYLRCFVEMYYAHRDAFCFPPWLDPCRLRDAKGNSLFATAASVAAVCKGLSASDAAEAASKKISECGYDWSSLWVPAEGHPLAKENRTPHFTPGMAQYWGFKKRLFDKIVLFKMGRFYEMFYIDACIGHKVLGLRWMGAAEKAHVGFPEQSLSHHAAALLNAGFKAVVVEQVETPKELEKRKEMGSRDKAVRREVCQALTASAVPSDCNVGPHSRLLLVLSVASDAADVRQEETDTREATSTSSTTSTTPQDEAHPYAWGVCAVDIACNKVYIHRSADDHRWSSLRSLLAKTLPVEVVFDMKKTPPSLAIALKSLPFAPQLSPLSAFPDLLRSMELTEKWLRPRVSGAKGEDSAAFCLAACEKSPTLLRSVGGACHYLEELLLAEQVLPVAAFKALSPEVREVLELDGKALAQLEVLASSEGDPRKALFACVDRTVYNGGSRLLRRWIVSPLRDKRQIDARLDAVAWFLDPDHQQLLQDQRSMLKALPDVERLSARFCALRQQASRGAVYFEDVHSKTLSSFLALMSAFESIGKVMAAVKQVLKAEEASLTRGSQEMHQNKARQPTRLWELCSSDAAEGGKFVDLTSDIQEIRDAFCLEGDEVKPRKGLVKEYDAAEEAVARTTEKLENLLVQIQKTLGVPDLKYTHSKFRYEVECADSLAKEVQRRLGGEVTSAKKGFIRFRTPEIAEALDELETHELSLKDAHYPFRAFVFNLFSSKYLPRFEPVAAAAAELDVLMSLAVFAQTHPGPGLCRPIIREPHPDEEAVLVLKNARHPMVECLKEGFVANDVCLNKPSSTSEEGSSQGGDEHEAGSHRMAIITGPNMGGKSTLLRQTCLCVILAQMGSFVPASYCELTPVDAIFTRLGAEDSILQGASTFLLELQDILEVTRRACDDLQGSRYSLAVIDELGRGTCTFDGTAIALASAEYLTDEVQCRCLFATHYHMIGYEMRTHPKVSNFHLGASIVGEDVVFNYKLRRGICPSSHGILVAKLAGVPLSVLQEARERSRELQKKVHQQQRDVRQRTVASALLEALRSEGHLRRRRLLECFKTFREEVRADEQEEAEERKEAEAVAESPSKGAVSGGRSGSSDDMHVDS